MSKIICRYCNHEAPDLPELKTHVRGNHNQQWREFAKQMALYDQAHTAELSPVCPICSHRGRHGH